ncbi:MAG: sulfatase [Phycisphaeraceae bacterium]|nr:sulfatase [Phycisphaeraceae bacterium]
MFVGLVGGLGLTLPHWLRSTAHGAQKFYETREGPAQSIIHIFLPGGMAHQESFDPKPYAPIEYRGPYGSIETKLAGVRFSEVFPETAKISDRITVCRSMTHGEAAHERGTHNMFTGYRPSPALQYPSMGSVVSHEFGPRRNLPAYVCIPGQPTTYAGSGYLSTAYGPFSLGSDPSDGGFAVRDLSLPDGVDNERFARRRTLLETVDDHFRQLEQSDRLDSMDTFYQQAYSLISSKEAREAFNIKAEPKALRDQYGRHASGQRMLLARRLVEAGVRFVSLTSGGWDHHDNIKGGFRGPAGQLDQAFARLIQDLDERGLLDTTLVMITTEFGRTPKINNNNGRDHWPRVFSVVLAGGGIRRGFVHGESDALAGAPEKDPLTVENLATTMYHQLGIAADKELMAPGDRPIEIVKGGEVVRALLA